MTTRRETPRKRTSLKGANQETVKNSGSSVRAKKADSGGVKVDPATRYNLIARAAYLRAEKRGFASGNEMQDWLEAESEIERLLKS